MKCDMCGTEMDEFGDDEVDRTDTDSADKVKVMCPTCGHIQYGCRQKIELNGSD
jgi:RNase P subunit RPR2